MERWLWKRYLWLALLPVLVIELGFIAAYWLSTVLTYHANVEAVGSMSTDTLSQITQREAQGIGDRLLAVQGLTRLLAGQVGLALRTPVTAIPAEERARHVLAPSGMLYTDRDNGGAAAYYSGLFPVGAPELDKVWRSTRVDPVLRSIVEAEPMVVQAYLNTPDSYNRIYPYRDVLATYAPKLDIPSFNFYYEADAAHNPRREVVWTDAYLDPAGAGWLVSAIAPVYAADDALESVVGLDVTLDALIERVVSMNLPWNGYGVLIGRDGSVLALPSRGESDWSLKAGDDVDYQHAIQRNTFRPADFNVHQRPDTRALSAALRRSAVGTLDDVQLNGASLHASWAVIPGPGWTLLTLTPEDHILQSAHDLNLRLKSIGYAMIAALLLFYALFIVSLIRRARRVGAEVVQPVVQLGTMLERIGEGDYDSVPPRSAIDELNVVARTATRVGHRLEETQRSISRYQERLSASLARERSVTQAQRLFINVVSHEFRNPLAIIDSSAQALERRADRLSPEALAERVAQIRAAVRRLSDITDGALAFLQLQERELRSTTDVRRFPALFAAMLDRLLLSFPGRRADIDVDLGDVEDLGSRDPAVVTVLLSTLLDHALRHSTAGTAIRVQARRQDQRLVFRIHDRGAGMDSTTTARLSSEDHSGDAFRGAGLHVARMFAETVDGQLQIDSQPGAGTTVELSFPTGG